MATFVLLEINCDHIEGCDAEALGLHIKLAARNPQAYVGAYFEYASEVTRTMRLVGQTGERTYAEDIKRYWLWKPITEGI